jgi:CxxC-x17-CxxC domain-containing protein
MFPFTAAEQEYFKSRGYDRNPRLCLDCRKKNQTEPTGNRSTIFGGRMFAAKCALCGRPTEVPFDPSTKPLIYCYDCYSRVKSN